MAVRPWARKLTESVLGGPPFKVGDIVTHPSGYKVKIQSGQYWGTHGLSNYWTWRVVCDDGSLGESQGGYGWYPRKEKHENH